MCSITCTQLRVEKRLQLLSACPTACLPGVLKGAPRLDEQFEIPTLERGSESPPLLPCTPCEGKAKTIDRQFPYEMKINMTFLGLCTFVQQLVSLTRSSTRLGCLGQNLIPLNRDPAPRPQPTAPHLAVTAIKCHLLLWQGSTGADCA